ncbi:NAD(P)/FAD-dependent oxidoreductase [Rhizobium sp. NPDC090279]|uniref:NAD(P)/FAD-dependent oxidoreductase n=1 Tax=Rhizobium sp. NPDC090279 TaxID=3364499 RepID=UPI00383B621C
MRGKSSTNPARQQRENFSAISMADFPESRTKTAMTGKIIVVGAGIIGATAALRLAEAGWDVALCDGNPPGSEAGASYGNGGWISPASIIPMSMPGLWRKVPAFLLDRNGPLTIDWTSLPQLAPWLLRFLWAGASRTRVRRTAKLLNFLLHDGPERHLELARKIGQDQLILQKGLLYAYPDRASFEAEALSWELRRENGVAYVEWDEAELRKRLPALSPSYRFAVHVVNGAHCRDTGRYVAGIVEEAQRKGVQFHQSTVTAILDGAMPQVVLESGETLSADRIVIAAGIYSGRLLHRLGVRIPMQSERGYHVTVASGQTPFEIPVMPSTGRMANTPTDMGLRLSGQVELATVDKPPNWERAQVLQRHALASYPYLSEDKTPKLRLWMGHRPSTPDGLPVIGPLSRHPALIAAFGHGHVGIAAAPKTADLVLEAVENRVNDDALPFLPSRFRQ